MLILEAQIPGPDKLFSTQILIDQAGRRVGRAERVRGQPRLRARRTPLAQVARIHVPARGERVVVRAELPRREAEAVLAAPEGAEAAAHAA